MPACCTLHTEEAGALNAKHIDSSTLKSLANTKLRLHMHQRYHSHLKENLVLCPGQGVLSHDGDAILDKHDATWLRCSMDISCAQQAIAPLCLLTERSIAYDV